jgi:hypothetical protein
MARGGKKAAGAQIIVELDTKRPIEVGDFVAAFTSVESQYEKFVKQNYPDATGEAKMFVREIKKGSIIAELLPFVPYVLLGLSPIITQMDQILIVDEFVRKYGRMLKAYFKKGGKVEDATKSDLKDLMGAVVAIANDPDGKAAIKAVTFEDNKRKVKTVIEFDSKQAYQAVQNIEAQQRTLEHESHADHQRVLMVFRQSNVKNPPVGKRTGEWVVIDEISDRELPLIYASDLAEHRIKHEIREADDNVYKKGFVVDVNLHTRGPKPVAYRVTNLHQVIDLPSDAA